jgi:hypothetical protein
MHFLARRLVTIERGMDSLPALEELAVKAADYKRVDALFAELGFVALRKKGFGKA